MFYFALLQILMKQQMSNFLTYRAENFESVINSAKEIVNILDVNDEQINNPKDNKKKIKVCRKAAHKQPIFSCT
jgi:hypothetical protein